MAPEWYEEYTLFFGCNSQEEIDEFKQYLRYRYHMDLEGMQPEDLADIDRTEFERLRHYEEYLQDLVYMATLGRAKTYKELVKRLGY
jgi:hypothetical protein